MVQTTRTSFELRREMILDSVALVFAEKGLAATTKELSKAAGVSEALLYKHFKSKDELFEQVKERCCLQAYQYAEQVRILEEPLERLVFAVLLLTYSVLVGFKEDAISRAEVQRLLLHSLSSKGDFALQVFSKFKPWVPFIITDMEACRKNGELEKTFIADERLVWMVHHFILGLALTRLPAKTLGVFDLESKKLVQEMAAQALVILGRPHLEAQKSIQKIFKSKKNIKKFNFLKEWSA